MLIVAFFWIPLVYFFNESREDRSDIDYDDTSLVQRVTNAVKKTVRDREKHDFNRSSL